MKQVTVRVAIKDVDEDGKAWIVGDPWIINFPSMDDATAYKDQYVQWHKDHPEAMPNTYFEFEFYDNEQVFNTTFKRGDVWHVNDRRMIP